MENKEIKNEEKVIDGKIISERNSNKNTKTNPVEEFFSSKI